MQSAREPSMEDILASIKRVIAEEKEIRSAAPAAPPAPEAVDEAPPSVDEDVLELDESMEAAAPVDLGPPLLDEGAAGSSRARLEELSTLAATTPPVVVVNPLEEVVREMLKPILKQWLDDHLPAIVDEHVKREISRITGRKL